MSEPETWLGNIKKCCCEVGFDPVVFTSTYGGSEPGVPTIAIPRTACTGCGLPLPHAAGECKREAK